jgi:hypothetical protein
MLLYQGVAELICRHLEAIAGGAKPKLIEIGVLTDEQHAAINKLRKTAGFPGLEAPELVYVGRHHFYSRSKQGYTIEDMRLQLEASLHADSIVRATHVMTAIQSVRLRDDGYGFKVTDRAILELTARKPRAEVLSVIPYGDGRDAKK